MNNITVIYDKNIKDVEINDFDSVIKEASLDAIIKVFEFRKKYFSIQAEEDPAGLFAEHLRQFRKTKRIPSFPSEKRMLVSDRVYKYITDLNTLQDDFFFSRFEPYLITVDSVGSVCATKKSNTEVEGPNFFKGVSSYLIPSLDKIHLFEHNFASSELGDYLLKVLAGDSKGDLDKFKSKFNNFFASIIEERLDTFKKMSPGYLVEKFVSASEANDVSTARQVLSEFHLTSDFNREFWELSYNEELIHQFLLCIEKLVSSLSQDKSCKFPSINLSVLKLLDWGEVSDKDKTRAVDFTIKYNKLFGETFGAVNSEAFSDFSGIPDDLSRLLLYFVTEESARFFATEFYKKLDGREKSSNTELAYKSSVVFTKEQVREIFNLNGESFSMSISLNKALKFVDQLQESNWFPNGKSIRLAFINEFNKLGRMKIYSNSSQGILVSEKAFLKDINFLLEQIEKVKRINEKNTPLPVNIIASESTKEQLLQALKLLQASNYRPEIITDDFIDLLQKQIKESVYINI